MTTPAESLARCERELHPARLYGAVQIGRVMGLHPGSVTRAAADGRLETLARDPLRAYGLQVLRFARWRAAQVRSGSGVMASAASGNAKLGRAAVTLVARQSCPTSCAFHQEGCYAEHDNNRIHWDRVTAGAPGATPLELAEAEAAAIDGLPGDRDLRLHVAGDSTTEAGTRLIAAACGRYVGRGRAKGYEVRAWAYTHAWRAVPRDAWGPVSVLASCETAADVELAHARGYAAAVVAAEFDRAAAYPLGGAAGVKVLPCPQQTRGRVCTECRLCFDDGRLRGARLAIGFALHGGGVRKAAAALKRVALPMAA